MTPSPQHLALPALIAGAIGVAFAPLFVRFSEVGPVATAFYRLLLALPVFWLWAMARDAGGPLSINRRTFRQLFLAAAFFSADLGVWHWSLHFTTVANSTLLTNLAPVFVTLGGWLLFAEKPRPLFLVAMAVAVAGGAVLVGDSLGAGLRRVEGDLLGIATAFFLGGYLLVVGRLRASLPTATLMAWTSILAPLMLLPVAVASGETLLPATLHGWLLMAGLALISQVLGQALIAYALAHLPAAFGALTLLLTPAVAALLAWALLGEAITPWQLVGGAVIILGILLGRRAGRA